MSLLFDTPANKGKTDILKGIARRCEDNQDGVLYHGWLNSTSKLKTKGKYSPPSDSKSFIKTLKVKPESIVIAALNKKNLNTFKELMIYVLSLDSNMGGFHNTPKLAPSVAETDLQEQNVQDSKDAEIVQDVTESSPTTTSKVLAKSTRKQSQPVIDKDDEWADEDDQGSGKLNIEDDNHIVDEVYVVYNIFMLFIFNTE